MSTLRVCKQPLVLAKLILCSIKCENLVHFRVGVPFVAQLNPVLGRQFGTYSLTPLANEGCPCFPYWHLSGFACRVVRGEREFFHTPNEPARTGGFTSPSLVHVVCLTGCALSPTTTFDVSTSFCHLYNFVGALRHRPTCLSRSLYTSISCRLSPDASSNVQ